MPSLNFESNDHRPKGSKKSLKLIIGIGTITGVIVLGSTLASSISLNGGDPVEFGQGITQSVACDNEITVITRSKFINSNYTEFSAQSVLDAIEISGVDLSEPGYDYKEDVEASSSDQLAHPGQYINSDGDWTNTCSGKKFVIKIFTKQSDYVSFTVDGNINSPLALNQYLTAEGNELVNSVVAISPDGERIPPPDGDLYYCFAQPVDLVLNTGFNYDVCEKNYSRDNGVGIKSTLDNVTLRYVVNDNPSVSGIGSYTSEDEYSLYMGAPAAAVDSVTIESMDQIPSTFQGLN